MEIDQEIVLRPRFQKSLSMTREVFMDYVYVFALSYFRIFYRRLDLVVHSIYLKKSNGTSFNSHDFDGAYLGGSLYLRKDGQEKGRRSNERITTVLG